MQGPSIFISGSKQLLPQLKILINMPFIHQIYMSSINRQNKNLLKPPKLIIIIHKTSFTHLYTFL